MQTPQGTFELKSFMKKIQNSDLASILLGSGKDRKEYFITMLSSLLIFFLVRRWAGRKPKKRGSRLHKPSTEQSQSVALDQFTDMEEAGSMMVSGTLWSEEERKEQWREGRVGGGVSRAHGALGPSSPGAVTLSVCRLPANVSKLEWYFSSSTHVSLRKKEILQLW